MFDRWRTRRRDRQQVSRISLPGSGVHVCPECHAPFVHPVDRDRLDESTWSMRLRCGECGHERDVVLAASVAERFDDDLRAAAREIEQAIAALTRPG